MNRIGLCVASISAVLGLASGVQGADAPARPVGLFDTLRPLAGAPAGAALETKSGWQPIAEEKMDHGFQGDAVLCNRRMAVVLRRGSSGAEVYCRKEKGWSREATLIPCGSNKAQEMRSVKTVANDADAVAVEASFGASGAKSLGLVCRLIPETMFVRTEPRGDTTRLDIQAGGRFALIPDFYADDITLDATRIAMARVSVPSENMVAHPIRGGQTLAVTLWDGQPQEVDMTLAGNGPDRVVSGTEVRFAKRGTIYWGLLDSMGNCYAGVLAGLPDRTGPMAGYKLGGPVKRLDWKMPFPAQWRVDFVTAGIDPELVHSREMLAPYPYPVKDGKCQGFRFIKPSYVWDWGGGTHTEMGGTPDKYPSWVDFEGRGHVRPVGESYAVIVYPFDRGRGTPLEATTLTDLVRQTLGVGPCQYVLDAERKMAQTPGIFTCGGTDMLKKLEGRMSQRRPEAEKLLDDMLVFVNAYRRRIEQYIAFRQDLLAYLESQEKQHPDQQPLIRGMKLRLGAIPAKIDKDYPGVIQQLNVTYRTTLNSDDEAARKTREQMHRRYTAAGGAQDSILERCHQATKLLRYQAGMTPAADPVTAQIALEVRRRASAVLQNPMYHETKDRHRIPGK